MLRVAICDDEKSTSSLLEEILIESVTSNGVTDVEFDVFESGQSLVSLMEKNEVNYQIIFLDIEMPKLNGIETAKMIRKFDQKAFIIYVTAYEKYSIESFEVRPYRYLLKPLKKEQIERVMLKAIEDILKSDQFFFFSYLGINYQVKCDEIISMESKKNRMIELKIKTDSRALSFYGKIKELENVFNPLSFVKVNSGTLINMNYIAKIVSSEIYLENKQIVTVSRGQKKWVTKAYRKFTKRKSGVHNFE